MKVEDFERYKLAYIKARYAQGRLVDDSQRDAWWQYLAPYSIDAVEHAIQAAVLAAGRYEVAVGDIAAHARDYVQSHGAGHGGGQCAQCEGSGWVHRMTATGETLSEADFRAWKLHFAGGPREDGQPHYRMRRCACRVTQAVA